MKFYGNTVGTVSGVRSYRGNCNNGCEKYCGSGIKNPYLITDFFADLFSSSTETAKVNEVDDYLASTESASDVLSFWAAKQKQWPRLSLAVKWVLSTPATSTSSERVFSVAGRTLDDRRSQLKPETVDGLLFLHGLSD